MSIVEFRMYEALRKHWTDEEAMEFIQSLDERVATKIEIMKQDLATKNDISILRADIDGVKADIIDFKVEVRAEFAKIRLDFHKAMNQHTLAQLVAIIAAVVTIILAKN